VQFGTLKSLNIRLAVSVKAMLQQIESETGQTPSEGYPHGHMMGGKMLMWSCDVPSCSKKRHCPSASQTL